jgi:hypothetical protein
MIAMVCGLCPLVGGMRTQRDQRRQDRLISAFWVFLSVKKLAPASRQIFCVLRAGEVGEDEEGGGRRSHVHLTQYVDATAFGQLTGAILLRPLSAPQPRRSVRWRTWKPMN